MYRILPPPVQGDSLAIQEEENGAPRKPVSAPRPGWPEAGCFQRVKQHYQLSLLMLTEVTQSGKNEGSRVRLPWAHGHAAGQPTPACAQAARGAASASLCAHAAC